jgi:hypothetical protein
MMRKLTGRAIGAALPGVISNAGRLSLTTLYFIQRGYLAATFYETTAYRYRPVDRRIATGAK